jgi:hypothetical protein
MKCLPFAWLCLLWVPPTNVCAAVVNGIDILSSAYSIAAPWCYTWSTNGSMGQNVTAYSSGNYGGSSSDGSAVSGQLTSLGPFPPGLAFPGVSGSAYISGSSAIVFENHTSANQNGPFWTGSDGVVYSLSSDVYPDAQANLTFRPTGESLEIALYISSRSIYYGYSGLSLSLSDITRPGVLLAYSESDTWDRGNGYFGGGSGPNGPPISVTDLFSVSTSDTYELTIHGWADTFDTDFANQSVLASIQIVPEPSAFGLCLLGLLSLAGFKTTWPLGHSRR